MDNLNQPFEVVCYDENNEIVLDETVSMTKQINTPELRYAREGYRFRGWAYEPDQTTPKIRPDSSILYRTYKTQVNDGKLNLYAVWSEDAELTIAWDAYTAGSGLTTEIIDAFKPKIVNAVEAEFGFAPTIRYRAMEDQKIADKTAEIKRVGDVDIVLGFVADINKPSYGNLTMTGYNSAFNFAGKTRTLGRLNNKDMTVFVYNWLNDQTNYVKERTSEHDLVLGWGWNGNVGTSPATGVLDYQRFAKVRAKLTEYLSSQGYSDLDLVFRPYRCTPAATAGENINTDGDVDLLFGFGSTMTTTGNVEAYLSKSMKIDDNTRYVFQLNLGSDVVNLAYDWLTSSDCLAALERDEHKTITFGFDMRSTSGITQDMVDSYSRKVNSYLFMNDLDYTIVLNTYSQSDTSEMGAAMLADNVDIVLGMGSNFLSVGGITFYASKTLSINGVSDRRILQTVNYDEVAQIYEWTLQNGLTCFNGVLS